MSLLDFLRSLTSLSGPVGARGGLHTSTVARLRLNMKPAHTASLSSAKRGKLGTRSKAPERFREFNRSSAQESLAMSREEKNIVRKKLGFAPVGSRRERLKKIYEHNGLLETAERLGLLED